MSKQLAHKLKFLVSLVALLATAGCYPGGTSSSEFALPEGNAEHGKEAFVSLGCTSCHRVRSLDLPLPAAEGPVMVVLGGNVSKVKSYGELVSSIINPSHRLARGFSKDKVTLEGESLMVVYNDVLTVTDLIDLVAFLQAEYEVVQRPGYRYPVYEYKN